MKDTLQYYSIFSLYFILMVAGGTLMVVGLDMVLTVSASAGIGLIVLGVTYLWCGLRIVDWCFR